MHRWKLLQGHEQQRRNVTRNSHEQVDGSGNGTGANDAPVADAAPAEEGAEEEATASSDAQRGVVIRCPICMDVYSEIMEHGRQLVATMCGHVFCSRCLPIALETDELCPTCRVDLTLYYDLYHPIYL
ncbi:E3 ubiquitin-protein ligase RNF4-like [Corvus hawaiiensis]|uniref:E3 ubiquitin-protein ligase RNF4-like n=1 Tax=Corvus hawaiiensis TaxID=134902 RepID=UPI0020188442|nr:E3 ubiquitin-protein ligase RNF4-like [Corvus hawaiiensis]XP_048161063.1 E3 ubiquitin-protein ligase RNF4-like [Corvus hawaiiensis]